MARKRRSLADRFGAWAVVTGASDGIGRAVAERLAEEGLSLVLVARRASRLDGLAAELRERHGVEVETMPLDLSRPEEVERLVRDTAGRDVGVLVAAAGFGSSGPLIEGDLEAELDMLDVNCRAVLTLAHSFGRRFAERGRGSMVLFGSVVGWQGVPFAANYAATKAYVQSLAEGLRVELAPSGVQVLAVAPGPVATGFGARAQMRMDGATPAPVAAAAIVRALGRSGTLVPGGLGKLLTYSLALLPRGLRVRVMARAMKGMAGGGSTAGRKAA